MADERDEIRQRADIVELVGQRVSLKKQGRDWKGLCPFHDDKNPSFTVSREHGRYKCWSCGAAGDVFNWVMETQRVDFAEAMRILAKETGVELQQGRFDGANKGERERLELAMDAAQNFFRSELGKSPIARDYVEDRGLPAEVLDRWEIGYGPSVGEALAVALSRAGHNLNECKSLFLVDQDPSGGFYDRFRGRLMFPIRDERGKLVAFGGRIIGDGQPKYINSSDTPLYRKSRVLYGMNLAKSKMSETGRAVLCEGYMDVIACHRAGVTEAVASLGTALAEEHVKLLSRWCKEVVILYDSDSAGMKATEKAIDLLQTGGIAVRVAHVDDGKDPDDLLETGGPGAVLKAVEDAIPPVEFRLKVLRGRLNPSQDEYWAEVVDVLASARTPLELERYLPGVAREYPGTKDQVAARKALQSMVRAKQRTKAGKGDSSREVPLDTGSGKPKGTVRLTGPERVVFRCLADRKLVGVAWRLLKEPEIFETPTGSRLAEEIFRSSPEPPSDESSVWVGRLDNDKAKDVLFEIWSGSGEPLTLSSLEESEIRLRRSFELRSLRESVESGKESPDLTEIYERMKKLKGEETS